MSFHDNISDEMALQQHYSDPKTSPPTWLNSSILRQQPNHHYEPTGNFLHLQTSTNSDSSNSNNHWLSSRDGAREPSQMFEDVNDGGNMKVSQREEKVDNEREWEFAKCKADILSHPMYDQLLSAHVSCLRIATPVDQLPRIDAQLAQSQQVIAKYSVFGNHDQQPIDDKDLNQFMVITQQTAFLHQLFFEFC